jgi:hypothetical protein
VEETTSGQDPINPAAKITMNISVGMEIKTRKVLAVAVELHISKVRVLQVQVLQAQTISLRFLREALLLDMLRKRRMHQEAK